MRNRRMMILASALLVGVVGALGLNAGQGRGKPARLASAARNDPFARRPATGGKWHSSLTIRKPNPGRPGWLNVLATLHVREPNVPQHDIEFAIEVHIRDLDDNVYVEGDTIGIGLDKGGEGNWDQDFQGVYNLPKGQYVVQVNARDLNRQRRSKDGTRSPLIFAGGGGILTVR